MVARTASRLGIVLASGVAIHLGVPERPNAEPWLGEAHLERRVAELEERLELLTNRLAEMDRAGPTSAAPASVVAPFTVVDKAGKPIFLVQEKPRSFQVLSANGKILVTASAIETGGFVKALGNDQQHQAVMGVSGKFTGMMVRDSPDRMRASLFIDADGRSGASVANDNGTQVAVLGLGKNGGGYLTLGNAAGDAVVEAGGTANNCGVVRVYPTGNAAVGLVGRPPWLLLGMSSHCE